MAHTAPSCIGIIIDGNRRWAREQGLPTLEGHRKGLQKLVETARWVRDAGVSHLAVYTFSTENWNREPAEVAHLMELIEKALDTAFEELKKEGTRIHFVGDLSRLSSKTQKRIAKLETESAAHDAFHLWVCLSYGGRLEIEEAVKRLVASGEEVTQDSLRAHMWSAGMPDPDLIIRTGGDQRLSNFLLWQAAYTELFFTPTYWPAFTKEELHTILEAYSQRERRYGT